MNTRLLDATTRHQVFLQRYAAGEAKKALTALNRLRRDIISRLSQNPTEFQSNRLSLMLSDIEILINDTFQGIIATLRSDAVNLARNEIDTHSEIIRRSTGVSLIAPSDAALVAVVEQSAINPAGANLADTLRKLSAKKQKEVIRAITDGVALGDSGQKIAASVADNLAHLTRRQVETVVRTSVNHLSSVARGALYEGNRELIDGYKWVATLDGRTTLICASRDGEVYQVGLGPMPPAHWGCRSTTVPEVKNAANIGKRPSASGQVTAQTTYGEWLSTQPIEFIDEALGVERSRLFRSGELTLDKFVDPTGRVYTLTQLRQMHPFIFDPLRD
jgi:SPP1 gp7 family putative phage head morphogenesis protein